MTTIVRELPVDLQEGFKWEAEYAKIPELMRGAIKRYLLSHIAPGDFLTAVLQNNLVNAVFRADDENIHLLPIYVRWFYNFAPINSWGSPEKVKTWLAARE